MALAGSSAACRAPPWVGTQRQLSTASSKAFAVSEQELRSTSRTARAYGGSVRWEYEGIAEDQQKAGVSTRLSFPDGDCEGAYSQLNTQ